MAIESNIGKPSGLEKTINKLHTLSLFSKNDFSQPSEILKQSDYVVKLKLNNNISRYKTFVNDIFFEYTKTKDPEKIKYNDLLSVIFSYGKKSGSESDWRQSEISDVIESLNGNNLDYVENKKNFLRTKEVLPAYLLVRSLKEENSKWLGEILAKFSKQDKEGIVNEVINLKKSLLESVHDPDAFVLLSSQLEKSLEVERVTNRSRITMTSKERDIGATEYKVKFIRNFCDSRLKEELVRQDNDIFIPSNFFEIDLESGTFIISDSNMEKINNETPDIKIFPEMLPNREDLGAFFALPILSTDIEYNYFVVPPTKNDLPVIGAFTKVFKDMSTNKEVFNRLSKIYKTSIGDNTDGANVNQEFAIMLFKSVNGDTPYTIRQVINFLETPYCKKAVLSLKKLLALELVERDLNKRVLLEQTEVRDFTSLNIDLLSQFGPYNKRKERKRKLSVLKGLE